MSYRATGSIFQNILSWVKCDSNIYFQISLNIKQDLESLYAEIFNVKMCGYPLSLGLNAPNLVKTSCNVIVP